MAGVGAVAAITMRWAGIRPLLIGSKREGIVALELERRVELMVLGVGVVSRRLVGEMKLGEELQMKLYKPVV